MKVYKAPNKKAKFSAIAVCLLLTAMLAIGGTLAYLYTHTEPVVNTFNPVTPGTHIDEDPFEGEVKSNVVVTNTGDVDSYIRAKVVITWQNEDGEVYPIEPVEKTAENDGHYTIEYGTDWIFGDDGYWYYKDDVPATNPDSATAPLITEAKWVKACEDKTYTLHIEILSQAIQSTPTDAVESVWPVSVDDKGYLTKG